ncbi:MAG: S-layer homology domain-containing protein [Fimbriimonadaceae bacterium]|nr:S-layer homology domain-containing protein [Fimbriimonadaceae bacterium]
MNRTFKFALAAVLAVGLALPATAQNFPDVPDNHWAYDALENLRGSVLFGYPDGLYRGNRPTSRYEFAVALNQLYMRFMETTEGLDGRISALEDMMDNMGGGTDNSAAIADLRSMLEAMKRDVDSMKAWQNDINTFRRLAGEFERELAAMGVNMDELSSQVASIDERLRKLEGMGGGMVNISGDANLLILNGNSQNNDFGLTQDGRPTGVSNAGGPVGFTRDFNVLHELGINLSGNVDENVSFNATLVGGNLLNNAGGLNNLNTNNPFTQNTGGGLFGNQGANGINGFEFWIHNLQLNFNSSLAGQGFAAQVGRVQHKVGKFLWQRSDFTPWYSGDRYDDGQFTFDGAKLGFNFGEAQVWLFGGRNSNIRTMFGNELNAINMDFQANPVTATVDSTLGLQAMFGLGDNGKINLAYIIHDSDVNPTLNGGINRLSVYGAEAEFNFDNLTVGGRFSQSDAGRAGTNVINNDNTAWEGSLGYKGDNFSVMGGYRRVETNFFAAGSWDRLGTSWSPRNVEGFFGSVKFMPTDALSVYGKVQVMEGVQNGPAGLNAVAGFGANDNVNAFKVGVDYDITDGFGFMASYEDVRWDFNAGTDPSQRWFTVGFDYDLGSRSNFMITYTFSDVDFKGRQAQFGFANNRYRGGLLATQLGIKF